MAPRVVPSIGLVSVADSIIASLGSRNVAFSFVPYRSLTKTHRSEVRFSNLYALNRFLTTGNHFSSPLLAGSCSRNSVFDAVFYAVFNVHLAHRASSLKFTNADDSNLGDASMFRVILLFLDRRFSSRIVHMAGALTAIIFLDVLRPLNSTVSSSQPRAYTRGVHSLGREESAILCLVRSDQYLPFNIF